MQLFCSNCGNKVVLPEGKTVGFCGACGTPANASLLDSPAMNTTSGKKPGKKLGKIVAGLVALAAVGIVAAVSLTIFLPMLLTTPYQRAEMAFWSNVVAAMPDVAGGTQTSFSAAYIPSRDVRNLVGNFVHIPEVTVGGTISALGTQMLVDGMFTIDGDRVDMTAAVDGSEITIAMPNISRNFLRFVLDEEFRAATAGTELNERQFRRTMTNIAREYFAIADRVAEIESGITVRGGGITLTADRHRMTFRESDLMELVLYALREVAANQNLIDFMDENFAELALGFRNNGFAEAIADAIEDIEDELDRLRTDDIALRMTVYISNGQIVQRRIDRIMDADDIEIEFRHLVDDGNAFIDFTFNSDTNRINFGGRFMQDGRTWTGNGRLTVANRWRDWWTGGWSNWNETVIDYSVDGFRFADGLLEGLIEVNFADGRESFEIITDWSRYGRNGQRVSMTMTFTEFGRSYNLGELILTYTEQSISRLNMPNWDMRNAVIADSSGRASNDGADWRDLYDDLGRAARDFRGNDLLEALFEGLQDALRRDVFWSER